MKEKETGKIRTTQNSHARTQATARNKRTPAGTRASARVVHTRVRGKKKRRKTVMMRRIVLALLILGIGAGGSLLVWNLMPQTKVIRHLEAASEYIETREYEEAIASCEEALQIDSMSVKAYRAMAGVYQNQEDWESAEQVLYRGWETTQDEGLLQEYCVQVLNDAVADINEDNCSFDTLEKCIAAIETDPDNVDGYRLLDACYARLLGEEQTELFCGAFGSGEEGGCSFERYLAVMERMLSVYAEHPSEELKTEILQFALPRSQSISLELSHMTDYQALLGEISLLDENGSLTGLSACLDKAVWAQSAFADAFAIFESGEFEPIKDFMQSETYLSIRDQFIEGSMEYWDGKTYIPVSREKIQLTCEEGQWRFAFADFEDYPQTGGVIKIWGAKQEDAGVQRICISYEPASENGEYYPHTTYEFVYLYSNVKLGQENYVPQMNYRFETRVLTPEGMTSQLIGDWGGEHEWDMEY